MANTWITCPDLPVSLEYIRDCRTLKLLIVFMALFLDNILLTVVVPIFPEYLMVLDSENQAEDSHLIQVTEPEVSSASTATSWNWTDTTSGYNVTHPGRFEEEKYEDENVKVGWLLSSKAITQLLTNPVVGHITNRLGYSFPMFCGFIAMMTTTTLYAFGRSYPVLFLARSVQGIGSSCTAIAGMAMLAEIYQDDTERSKAMGIALGGLALGVVVGYPFGGVMYQFVGKVQVFLVIGALVLFTGAIQIWSLRLTWKVKDKPKGTPLSVLLRDPYIIIASGAIMFPEMAFAMLEPTLPIWLIENVHPEKWQLGLVFLPDSITYWVGCNLFGVLSVKLGRWRVTMFALALTGVCLCCIPLAKKIIHLLVPHLCLGIALGMADAAMMPLLALLVDTRHVPEYGSVYAIAEVAMSLAFAIGPSVGGQMVKCIGFTWLMRGIAIVNLLFSPLCYFLKNPPARTETSALKSQEDEISYGIVERKTETETHAFSYKRLE